MDNLNFLNYRTIELIGEGGMGKVYLAEDTMLDKKVALKVLNIELSQEPLFIERFRQEAKIQSKLVHPNIVTLHNLLVDNGRYFIVMEHAEGITLKELIHKTGPINEGRALKIFAQALDAVGYAHSRNVIHRDIKPSNMMISLNDEVKIMDFGIAKLLGERGLTSTGAKVGTLYYMSPEQIEKPKEVDYKTDLFSLGIVLFEMLTGNLPYNIDTESDFKLMNEIVNASIPDPRKYYPHISDKSIEIITTLTQKDKNKRYANCAQAFSFVKYGKIVDENIFKQAAPTVTEKRTESTPPPPPPPVPSEKTQIAPNFEAKSMAAQQPLAKQPEMSASSPLKQSIPFHTAIQKPIVSQSISNIPGSNKKKNSKTMAFVLAGLFIFLILAVSVFIKFVLLDSDGKPVESKSVIKKSEEPDSNKIRELIKSYLSDLYSKKEMGESSVSKDRTFEFKYSPTDKFEADNFNPYSNAYKTGDNILQLSNFMFTSFAENKFSGTYNLKNDDWDITSIISGISEKDKININEINYSTILFTGTVPDETLKTEKNTSSKDTKVKPNINKTTKTTPKTIEKPKENRDIEIKPKVRDPH